MPINMWTILLLTRQASCAVLATAANTSSTLTQDILYEHLPSQPVVKDRLCIHMSLGLTAAPPAIPHVDVDGTYKFLLSTCLIC
jgi:hypothetical protein